MRTDQTEIVIVVDNLKVCVRGCRVFGSPPTGIFNKLRLQDRRNRLAYPLLVSWVVAGATHNAVGRQILLAIDAHCTG